MIKNYLRVDLLNELIIFLFFIKQTNVKQIIQLLNSQKKKHIALIKGY